MIEFVIKKISIEGNLYRIQWDVSTEVDFLLRHDIVIKYSFELKKNYFLPLNIVLSGFLPVLVRRYKRVKVISDYPIDDITKTYWSNYIKEIIHSEDFELIFEGSSLISSQDDIFISDLSNIGLFFGGGVESMFALSTMYHKKPILISVTGKRWMNNDTESGNLKFAIERGLCESYNLQIQRVEMNLRPLMLFGDEEMNQFITGGLFYFLSLPIADMSNIGTIYHSMEYEYASTFCDWDLSLSPYFAKNLYIRDKRFPIIFSIYNAFPKIKMLEELSKTKFVGYIYSCFGNTDKRWCGNCSKCFRISEFCERIGLDRKIIGMQEGIIGLREKSPLARLYWHMMDKLYGRRWKREIKLMWEYYKKRWAHY